MPLVENIARKFKDSDAANGVISLSDRIQFGHIGLIKAIEKPDTFNPPENDNFERVGRTIEVLYKGVKILGTDLLLQWGMCPNMTRPFSDTTKVEMNYAICAPRIYKGRIESQFENKDQYDIFDFESSELSKMNTRKTLYILDEPTTGLHFEDIRILLNVLNQLVDKGNTIIIIEHNLDVIKTADWIVDLGPEGGSDGGEIVAEGTPEAVAKIKKSFTGKFLKETLD